MQQTTNLNRKSLFSLKYLFSSVIASSFLLNDMKYKKTIFRMIDRGQSYKEIIKLIEKRIKNEQH